MFALKICDKETGQQGCAKLTDFEWIVDILVAIIFLKISVLMLVLNDFYSIRNFRLRFRIVIYYFEAFGCDFE